MSYSSSDKETDLTFPPCDSCISVNLLHTVIRQVYHLTARSSDPTMLPSVQVDKGAIKFVLSGANIMCPGLTSPGARMNTALPQDTIVVSQQVMYAYTQVNISTAVE